jgi:hypothetical protein
MSVTVRFRAAEKSAHADTCQLDLRAGDRALMN